MMRRMGIVPSPICTQNPIHPSRENALARLPGVFDGLKPVFNACNTSTPSSHEPSEKPNLLPHSSELETKRPMPNFCDRNFATSCPLILFLVLSGRGEKFPVYPSAERRRSAADAILAWPVDVAEPITRSLIHTGGSIHSQRVTAIARVNPPAPW